MPAPSEGGMLFSFAEMESEIENMARLAEPFLEAGCVQQIIRPWVVQLQNLAGSQPGTGLTWRIGTDRPIKTIASNGEYEAGTKRGAHTVFGTLSSVWEIRTPKASGRAQKKHTKLKHFSLVGLASTKVIIWATEQAGEPVELARWRFEVGDAQSPGCHFHVQVMGEETDEIFPCTMKVPRLPGLLFTAMDSLEFLLAEIFQDAWKKHATEGNDRVKAWSHCQRNRLANLLDWQRGRIWNAAGSPWTSFKGQKPASDLFLTELKR